MRSSVVLRAYKVPCDIIELKEVAYSYATLAILNRSNACNCSTYPRSGFHICVRVGSSVLLTQSFVSSCSAVGNSQDATLPLFSFVSSSPSVNIREAFLEEWKWCLPFLEHLFLESHLYLLFLLPKLWFSRGFHMGKEWTAAFHASSIMRDWTPNCPASSYFRTPLSAIPSSRLKSA